MNDLQSVAKQSAVRPWRRSTPRSRSFRLAFAAAAMAFSGLTAGAQAQLTSADIGAVGVVGSSSKTGSVYTIQGSGSNIHGGSDQFHFVYEQMTGDGEVMARLHDFSTADGLAKTGVMMRENLTGNSKHASSLLLAEGLRRFAYRSTTGGITSASGDASPTEGWVRVVREGDTFTSYVSADGATWTDTGSVNITMPQTIYVGMAVSSRNNSVVSEITMDRYYSGPVGQMPTGTLIQLGGVGMFGLLIFRPGARRKRRGDQSRFSSLRH